MNRHRIRAEPYLPPSTDQVFRLVASPALVLLTLLGAMVLYGNWGSAILREDDLAADARTESVEGAAKRNADDLNRRMRVRDVARVLAL